MTVCPASGLALAVPVLFHKLGGSGHGNHNRADVFVAFACLTDPVVICGCFNVFVATPLPHGELLDSLVTALALAIVTVFCEFQA